jgi:hypothetical protein
MTLPLLRLAIAVAVIGFTHVSADTVHAQRIVAQTRDVKAIRGDSGYRLQTVNEIVPISGRLIVIEGETNSLLGMSRAGNVVSRTVNTGPTGARLGYPVHAVVVGERELLVLDSQSPRVARFTILPDTVALTSLVRLRGVTGVSGVCELGSRLFVVGVTQPPEKSGLFHQMSDVGQVVRSFGDGFGPAAEASRILFGTARVLCLPQDNRMIVASQYYPGVRSYGDDGRLQWSRTVPDFRAISYRETAPGRIEYTYPADSLWDQTVSVFRPAPDIIALQVGRRYGRNPARGLRVVRTLLFRLSDGEPLAAQSDLPIIKSADSSQLYSVENDGSLRVLSYSIRR